MDVQDNQMQGVPSEWYDGVEGDGERKQVTKLLECIKKARDFDEEIRKGYARDRRYARGDTGFEVEVNLIGSFIDTLIGFIYAKDPDIDARPSPQVEAPKEDPPKPPQLPVMDAVQGVGGAMAAGGDPMQAAQPALMQYGMELAAYQQEFKAWQERQQAKKQRRIERDLFAQTLEVVISKLWKKAKLKRQCRRQVRSAMTTSIGWLKVTWQERTARDPQTQQQIRDIQEMLERIVRLKEEIDEGQGEYSPEKEAELRQRMQALQESAEVVVARGLSIDFVDPENIQVAPGVEIMEYLTAPWMAERVFMRIEDAAVSFPDIPLEKLRKATRFARVKPQGVKRGVNDAPEGEVSAAEADKFTSAGGEGSGSGRVTGTDEDWIAVWEFWDLDAGIVKTTAEGLTCWLRKPAPPNVETQRFYPYFGLAFIEVDGDRSPQSLVQRSWTLQNEYSRTRSNFAEHRRRSMPGVLFDATEISEAEAKKLAAGRIQELTGLKTTSGKDLTACFAPKPVSGIDPVLYDVSPVRRDMEDIWGVQQALQGSIQTAKTATEAEIQQGGFQSRTGAMRDALEDMLSDLAEYTAEVLTQKLDVQDVLKLAGPDAVWPQMESPGELLELMQVSIKAGSSGKPNTRADREAWAAVVPLLQSLVPVIGQMRQAEPSEVADALEQLVMETMKRAGDGLDVARFIPQTEGTNMMADPMAAIQSMMGGDPAGVAGADSGATSPPQPAATSGGIAQEM